MGRPKTGPIGVVLGEAEGGLFFRPGEGEFWGGLALTGASCLTLCALSSLLLLLLLLLLFSESLPREQQFPIGERCNERVMERGKGEGIGPREERASEKRMGGFSERK